MSSSKCLFYRKKINFCVKNFTDKNIQKFIDKKGKAEMKFRVKVEAFGDELELKFYPNVKWDRENCETERGLGVSIGSILKNDLRTYNAIFRLFLVKESGELQYCSTADTKYIFNRLSEKSKIQRPMIRLETLFEEEGKFLWDENVLKIYVEMEIKSTFNLPLANNSIALKNYEILVNNPKLSDFQFICSDEKIINAHKCILMAFSNNSEDSSSHFFKSMLESNMRESVDNCMKINDIDSSTMLELMRFVYCEKVQCTETKDLIPLIVAADKYDIAMLKTACIGIMHTNLSIENVVEVLAIADTLDSMKDLKENCIDFIKFNYNSIKLSGRLQNVKFDLLAEIIDSMNRDSIYLNYDVDLKQSLEASELVELRAQQNLFHATLSNQYHVFLTDSMELLTEMRDRQNQRMINRET